MGKKYEVRCHEWSDESDYCIDTFDTKEEAEESIAKRDRERPGDIIYEHWYVYEMPPRK